ncbi:Amino acid permease-associated region protein [Aneurinibacillus migulanus]|nr:amino acid permease [Aneurinibacillus migulanus]CEH29216.1 Amino acid permease-associated region protein [Aneurinibacillus migulanus]
MLFVGIGLAIAKGVGNGFTIKPVYDSNHFSLPLVMGAVSIAVLSFLGFDGISTLAEETKGGTKTVGRAAIFALLGVGFLFITQTCIAAWIWPDFTTFKNADVAFYQVAELAGGPWLKNLCIIATAISWGLANALAVGLFFMDQLAALASLVNFGALTAFLLLHVSVINYFIIKQKSTRYVQHLTLPLIGFIIIGYVWYSLDALSKELGFIWLGVGVIYFIFLKLSKKLLIIKE